MTLMGLERDRVSEAAALPAAATGVTCPACQAAAGPDARFCAQCGAKLETTEAAGAG